MKVKSYKDLRIWQKGIEIVDKIYEITDNFPKSELYGLVSQMRRASVSVPSNIAEGFVRGHRKEYKQFLYISLASCAELETHLIIANRRKYVTETKTKIISEEIDYESRMIVTLINKLG
ncbi:MAG: four helix bundle protein [Candidatus Omnitrophota bacterium]